jgi:hypothetical protein
MKVLQASEHLTLRIFFQSVLLLFYSSLLLTLKRRQSTKDGIWGINMLGYNQYFYRDAIFNESALSLTACCSLR